MKYNDLFQQLKLSDLIALWLDEQGFSDSEIAGWTGLTPQTLHNIKNRAKPLTEALKQLEAPPSEYGKPEINKIINAFTKAFGTTKTTKWDRFAANRLDKKYGADEIVGAINALAAAQEDKYAPSVRSVSQFEEKLPNIVSYFKKRSNDQIINL